MIFVCQIRHNLLGQVIEVNSIQDGIDLVKKIVEERGVEMTDVVIEEIEEDCDYLSDDKDWPRNDIPHICIISGFYALRGANEDWNNGEVTLEFHGDWFGKEQDTFAIVKKLCKGRKDMSYGRN